jgi:hypothetical protein
LIARGYTAATSFTRGNIDDRETRPAVMTLNASATAFAARVPIAIHPIDRTRLPAATSMTAKRGLP